MDDMDKLRAAPQIQGTSAAAEHARNVWRKFIDGEVDEDEWEAAWDAYFRVVVAVANAKKTDSRD